MNYRTFLPPDSLTQFIRYFWSLEGNSADDSIKTFSAIPDGCPGMIMMRSEKEAFYTDDDKKLPNIFLYGQTITPATLSSDGRSGVIGICFQPHAIKSIFGLDADELTSSCLDLTSIKSKNKNFPDLSSGSLSIDDQVKALSVYLFDQYRSNNHNPDAMTQLALAEIAASKGRITLKELHEKTNLSERTLERRFKQNIGISPRLYSRIIRFQETMKHLRDNGNEKLSDVAYENEYFDQSHFIRAFKEFTGYSPLEFKKHTNEIIENFPQIVR